MHHGVTRPEAGTGFSASQVEESDPGSDDSAQQRIKKEEKKKKKEKQQFVCPNIYVLKNDKSKLGVNGTNVSFMHRKWPMQGTLIMWFMYKLYTVYTIYIYIV